MLTGIRHTYVTFDMNVYRILQHDLQEGLFSKTTWDVHMDISLCPSIQNIKNNIIGLYKHKNTLPQYKDDAIECKMS